MLPNEKPKQDLLMEVLAARHRLGEAVWTFREMHAKTIKQLEAEDYVFSMHGVVEGTIRAGLTEKGRKAYVSDSYEPPISRKENDEHEGTTGAARGHD